MSSYVKIHVISTICEKKEIITEELWSENELIEISRAPMRDGIRILEADSGCLPSAPEHYEKEDMK